MTLPEPLRQNLCSDRRHHTLLLCQLPRVNPSEFLKEAVRLMLCQSRDNPDCTTCQSCQLVHLEQHPDVLQIQPDKSGGQIKIEQIRTMLGTVFLSPKLSTQRVIIISPAEQLNLAAANALLKVLEEPPLGVYFILTADNPGLLLPTILSRCQIWRIAHDDAFMTSCHDLILRILFNDEDHPLSGAYQSIMDDLHHVLIEKTSVSLIAAKWQSFRLFDMTQILYCIVSQMIRDHMFENSNSFSSNRERLRVRREQLPLCPLSILFHALDYLHAVFEKINHTIHMNTQLVIENFLMIMVKEGRDEYGR